jgi:hypothetical protein
VIKEVHFWQNKKDEELARVLNKATAVSASPLLKKINYTQEIVGM